MQTHIHIHCVWATLTTSADLTLECGLARETFQEWPDCLYKYQCAFDLTLWRLIVS